MAENAQYPAFPVEREEALHGLTKREYFAARAPVEQLWHFDPVLPSPRPESIWRNRDIDAVPANVVEIEKWEREAERQRAIQWPWVWADAVLASTAPAARGLLRAAKELLETIDSLETDCDWPAYELRNLREAVEEEEGKIG
jgi:hypothetical protein